tara:strand:- start:502 stop:786 length:285 start_codon:yes stop_codon:yes gene_type:complete
MDDICTMMGETQVLCRFENYDLLISDKQALHDFLVHGTSVNLQPIRERLILYMRTLNLGPRISGLAERAANANDDICFAALKYMTILAIDEQVN